MRIADDVRRSIEAVWKLESARLIGGLARSVRDLDWAEDLAHDALIAALEHWPVDGIPDNPGAWLMTTARRRGIDRLRQQKIKERSRALLTDSPLITLTPPCEAIDEDVGDDLLRLVFIACHPVLSEEARVALTLRLVVGLTVEEIARACLVAETTLQQRIVRAKRTLKEARVPFELPVGGERTVRLESVLEVTYSIFNEGYAATRGDDLLRPQLCADALRLGRALAARMPEEAEVQGLLALMELSAARFKARVDVKGNPVLLLDQNRSRWDRHQISRGATALKRAEELRAPLGPYTLQAAIAACHARALTPEETDWERIVALYDALVECTASPVVELNRAMAVAMAFGPRQALALLDELSERPSLRSYHWVPSARGDLLARVGRIDEARAELRRAARMTRNHREQDMLLARIASLDEERP